MDTGDGLSWWNESTSPTVSSCFSHLNSANQQTSNRLLSRLTEELDTNKSVDLNSVPTALSWFTLEVCRRQLKQYHISGLDASTVVLNLGEGIDCSVDVSTLGNGEEVVKKHYKNNSEEIWDGTGKSPECTRIWRALQEIQIMTHPPIARCPNILSIVGFGWDYKEGKITTPSLILEYANIGTLRSYIRTSKSISEAQKLNIILDICRGVACLHKSGIIHGDIKMENILMAKDAEGNIISKLADFGSSIIITPGIALQSYTGTDIYNPPEVRRLANVHNGALIERDLLAYCDIYAFSLLALDVFLSGEIYADEAIEEVFQGKSPGNIEDLCLQRFDRLTFINEKPKQAADLSSPIHFHKVHYSGRTLLGSWKDYRLSQMVLGESSGTV
jgi:serine/threonine protein kinase